MDAAVARRLRPAHVADLLEHLPDERRDALGVAEIRPRLWIDIDAQLVGLLHVVTTRRPRVEVERRQVHGPDHLGELRHAELVGVPAGGERDARRLDPVRAVLGHALLVDGLALGAVGVALELRRTLVQRPHDAVADGHVVPGEVELRLAPVTEEELVRIRQAYEALPDLELDERSRHRLEATGGRR